MQRKHIAFGFVIGLAALCVGVSLANFPRQVSNRAEPVIYGLTLDSSNGISSTYSSTERSISTTSGNWQVSFSYTNVSPLTNGHCTIANGGTVVNSDHILSIEELTINFTPQLALCAFVPPMMRQLGEAIMMPSLERPILSHLILTILNFQP